MVSKKHKTDILHPEHLVCCFNLKVFEGPWKCPWGPFLESLCQLRMIVSYPADRPQTLNVNGKCCNRSEIVRLTFSADFFARNLAVNIHMGIRLNLARVGTRR